MEQVGLARTLKNLRLEIVHKFEDTTSAHLLVGTTCNFAFVGNVFFTPAMTHTSTLVLSYTDTAYISGALTAGLLLALTMRSQKRMLYIKALWMVSLLVALSFVLYSVLFFLDITPPQAMDWTCGALFGVYLPLATLSWLRVHARCRISIIVWNVMLSAVFGSFLMWILMGISNPQLCASMFVLLFIGTGTLAGSLRTTVGVVRETAEAHDRVSPRYPFAALFLFSFAFIVAISFAELEGTTTAFTAGVFFAPCLLACVLVLSLKNFTALSLLNIAVPAIATATISASFLRVDPVISFDLAVVGTFLFLVYSMILLCAQTQEHDLRVSSVMLRLMLAFSGGCIAGRVGTALCGLFKDTDPNLMVLFAILAVIGAMILCIRNGIVPKQMGELFHYGERASASQGVPPILNDTIDYISVEKNLGNREKEVLVLLLNKKTASEIAAELVIANGTAKSHIRHLYKKLNVHSRSELFELFGMERS